MLCDKSFEISQQEYSNNFLGILSYWILENSDYFKNEKKQRKSKDNLYLAYFFIR